MLPHSYLKEVRVDNVYCNVNVLHVHIGVLISKNQEGPVLLFI